MTTILLADADSKSRTDLLDKLQSLRSEWQVLGYSSGHSALHHVQSQSVDCLISDSNLTDMTARDLLTSVKQSAPETIRVIVCADQNHLRVLQSASDNHRFIDRNVDVIAIVESIENSLSLNQALDSKEMLNCINNTTSLPALPTIYNQMMDALASNKSTLEKVAKLVETDVGLSATILNIVNSAYYGLAQRVDSIAQCVSLLGAHLVKNITLTSRVFSQFEEQQIDLVKLRELNDQAMRTGALTNHFARIARLPKNLADQVQLAGMLGNIGELLQMSIDKASIEARTTFEAEQLGAYLLRSWQISDIVVEAVALQNKVPISASNQNQVLHILHSLRFLESNLSDFQDPIQINLCRSYLKQWASDSIVDRWLEAYTDMYQLSPVDDQPHARVA